MSPSPAETILPASVQSLSAANRAVLVAAEGGGSITPEHANALGVDASGLCALGQFGLLVQDTHGWRITDRGRELASSFCPRCYAALGDGVAFHQRMAGAAVEGRTPAIELREVAKCHSCGYSETIRPR